MEISRDADGLRFVGECAPEKGFVSGGHSMRRLRPPY